MAEIFRKVDQLEASESIHNRRLPIPIKGKLLVMTKKRDERSQSVFET